jgi:hypothetical protein
MKRAMHSTAFFFAVSLPVFAAWAWYLMPPVSIKLVECPHRVSARGIVHDSNSPWFGLVAADPCFATHAEAVEYARSMGR